MTEKPFIFLFCGGHTNPVDRKGGQFLAEAFNVFNKDDNVKCIFKINTVYNPSFNSEAHLRSLVKEELQNKLEFITVNLSEQELAELYRSADISVTPTMGEAFCQSILEAMACGTACIVTNYSGHLDYSLPEFTFLVPVAKRVIAHYGYFDVSAGSVWVLPDVDHLKEQLRWSYEHPKEVEEMGRKAAEYVHANFTWKKQAERCIEAVSNYTERYLKESNR